MSSKIDLKPVQDEHINALRSSLKSMGISSEIDPNKDVVQEDARQRRGRIEGANYRARCIKLEGMNIDVILYLVEQMTGKAYVLARPTLTDEWRAMCIYGVECNVGQREQELKNLEAKTEKKTKGFFREKLADFSWVGGPIADVLNQDTSLKEPILAYLINAQATRNREDIFIVPVYSLSEEEMEIDSKRPVIQGALIFGCATDGSKNQMTPLLLPSRDTFKAFDRIAKHIREYLLR
jgi:hypothetical protein